jgi:8-oxo-dGTP diphosphatase
MAFGKTRRNIWIPVVAGFIKKADEVLLGMRPQGTLAGQWEFPGGKIELGEPPQKALKRELKEELGIDAEIGALRIANTHTYGNRGVVILFYDVKYWKGEPKSQHHVDLQWVTPEKIPDLEIPEANRKILDQILEALK